jgi:DNA polymerase-3 subunit delta
MLNKRLDREIDMAFPFPLYFLWGKEALLLEEVLKTAEEKVISPQQKDFNYDVFYSSASPQDILNASYSLPFMAPRRLVVLKDFHLFSPSSVKALVPYLKKPNETTCMLIFSQKEPKAAIEAVWKTYRLHIRESDIPGWIRQRAAHRGIKLTDSAVDCLIEFLGADSGLLAAEIEKLVLSGRKTIDDDDIIASSGMVREYTPFNLIDAITAGRKTRAFRIMRSLIEKKSSDAASVLAPLNWHYRQFFTLWENKGKRPPKMRQSTYRALQHYLPKFTLGNFCDIFQSLHEADLRIKTSGRPEIALEILLVKLLRVGTGN